MAAGGQVGRGGVVGAHPCRHRGVAQADGEHRLAHTRGPDQEHVGGVFDEAQGGQLGDEFGVDRRLGGEVEVGQRERRRQGSERVMLTLRRSSTAATSTARSRSRNVWCDSFAFAASSSSPGSASAAAVSAGTPDGLAVSGSPSRRRSRRHLPAVDLCAAREGPGHDVGQGGQVHRRFRPGGSEELGPLDQRRLPGRLVRLAVTGPGGGVLARAPRSPTRRDAPGCAPPFPPPAAPGDGPPAAHRQA